MPRRLFRILSAATHPPGDAVADAELLRRYATSRDSAAFELLVRRHADAIWNACSRVLRNDADADDAFQATFLVLAKKAGSVRGASAGAWLHRVAVNVALKLRRTRSVSDGVDLTQTPSLTLRVRPEIEDDFAVVHEELARLPERYRLPVVLCDLEGHTHAEAAKLLGWPVGSVSGRLSRAHAILRDRLGRRGFAAVALSTCAAPSSVVSAVPSPLASSLAEGVLFAMRATKLKFVAALAVGLAGVASLGTVFALGTTEAPRVAVVQPPPDDDPPEKEPDPKTTPDPKWRQGPPFPTVFPDIKPLSQATLLEFQTQHVEPIYIADTPLQKLLKAKLQIILDGLAYEVRSVEDLKREPERKGVPPGLNRDWTTRHLDRIPGLVRDATAVAGELNMKGGPRPWLALRVAAEKRIEVSYEVMNFRVQGQETSRLDAEIALAKHDAKK